MVQLLLGGKTTKPNRILAAQKHVHETETRTKHASSTHTKEYKQVNIFSSPHGAVVNRVCRKLSGAATCTEWATLQGHDQSGPAETCFVTAANTSVLTRQFEHCLLHGTDKANAKN